MNSNNVKRSVSYSLSYYESQENQIEVIFIEEQKDDVSTNSIDTGYCFRAGSLDDAEQNIVEGMFIQSEILCLERRIRYLKTLFESKNLTVEILDDYMIHMNPLK